MGQKTIPKSRSYVHSTCKSVTILTEDGFDKLANPFSQAIRTLCAHCKDYFPLEEFYWEDTGETIADARSRLRSQVPGLLGWFGSVPGFFTLVLLGLVLGVTVGIVSGFLLGTLAGWIIGVIATLAGLVCAIRIWGAVESKIRTGIFDVEDYRQLK
jgi:hypothetical protein